MAVVVAPRFVSRWQRGRRRRIELGFPPVWWAALKVVLMVAVLVALVVGLPLLAIWELVGADG